MWHPVCTVSVPPHHGDGCTDNLSLGRDALTLLSSLHFVIAFIEFKEHTEKEHMHNYKNSPFDQNFNACTFHSAV